MNRIPRILHQTWKSADVPDRWRAFQLGWQRQHPDWEYRLWTDADLRELVRADAPDLLPVFDAYAEPICRADLGRYLALRRCGGLYVDLDFECLRPVEPLLAGRELVVGEEPASHLEIPSIRERRVPRILCNALLATTPGHPFWDSLLDRLRSQSHEPDPLDSTGPILFTRALLEYPEIERVTIVPAADVYPLDKFQARSPAAQEWAQRLRAEGRAYALHYWAGSWLPEWKREELRTRASEAPDAARP